MGRQVLIVAHGQPSDPGPAAAEIAALAGQVGRHLPGWSVAGVTLAEVGALARAIAVAGPRGLVYPLFMTGGWFSRVRLPRDLAEAGGAGWQVLEPFGTDPAVLALTVTLAQEAAAGRDPADVHLLLAAHGGARSKAPGQATRAVADRLRAETGFARVEAAFLEEPPLVADLARGWPADAICLPFFAARGDHVTQDLPAALAAAGFAGQLLPAVGSDARVPGLIAAALRRAAGQTV